MRQREVIIKILCKIEEKGRKDKIDQEKGDKERNSNYKDIM